MTYPPKSKDSCLEYCKSIGDMFEKYFEEYWVSEQELKEKIYSTLEFLTQVDSEKWLQEWLKYADPTKETGEILTALNANIPLVTSLGMSFEAHSPEESLRIISIVLDGALEDIRLDYFLPKVFYKQCTPYFLSIRYILAVEILQEKLHQELKYDRDKIYSFLTTKSYTNQNASESIFVSKLAHEEINRLFETPEGSRYAAEIMDFEDKMDVYIKENYRRLFQESFIKLCTEAIVKNSDIFNYKLGFEEKLTDQDAKSWLEDLEKRAKQTTNARLGIESTWGGRRKIRDFTWTDDNKCVFYYAVESIPKVLIKEKRLQKKVSLWEDLFRQFEYRGDEAIRLVSDKAPYDAIPKNLLIEAFRKWKNYEDNYANIKSEDCPRMFLYRHALFIVDFPKAYFSQRENREIEYKFSTLDKHYRRGKALCEIME